MGVKVNLLIGLLFLVPLTNASEKFISMEYSPDQYFKNYALSTCVADGYKAPEVIGDAAAAARGYLEQGGYPLEAHTEATLLGRSFLKKSYKSMSGEPLSLMKCIDFYHSEELDALAQKYRSKK